MINSVNLVGNIARDIESRITPAGSTVAWFTVAVNEVYGTGEGRQERTHWIPCSCFGATADFCIKRFFKGSKVAIQGTLNYDEWQGRDKKKQSKLSVKIRNIEVMSKDQGQHLEE